MVGYIDYKGAVAGDDKVEEIGPPVEQLGADGGASQETLSNVSETIQMTILPNFQEPKPEPMSGGSRIVPDCRQWRP
jgi:hypothetical protein